MSLSKMVLPRSIASLPRSAHSTNLHLRPLATSKFTRSLAPFALQASKTSLLSQNRPQCSRSKAAASSCPSKAKPTPSISTRDFWASPLTWKRAALNTFRCLVGCTSGDFAAMWYLQSFHPDLGVGMIMGVSSKWYLCSLALVLHEDSSDYSTTRCVSISSFQPSII